MDSLTQLTLGAACGQAILGKKVGRKALVWGAVLGTVPDLDVFIPLGGPVNDFVYHRGFSHSLLLLALLAPLAGLFISTVHKDTKRYYPQWILLSFIVLEASVLLDLFTIYGTQIFWPLDTTPKAIPVLFIIDPLFTLPLLLGTLAAFFFKNRRSLGHRLNSIGLTISLFYLIWAIGVGEYVNRQITQKLQNHKISYSKFISSPAPFTTLLWRTVGITDDQYFEIYYSIFDNKGPLDIQFYPRNMELRKGIEQHKPVVKLENFTRGYFSFSEVNGFVVMTDLRMGSEPAYVFQFKVAKLTGDTSIPIEDKRLKTEQDWRRLPLIWKRIWSPTSEE